MAIQDRKDRGKPGDQASAAELGEFGNVVVVGEVTREPPLVSEPPLQSTPSWNGHCGGPHEKLGALGDGPRCWQEAV